MIHKNFQAIILAAGKSSRFKTGKTKLLEKICGQEMILFATKLFETLDVPTTVVVGYQKELVTEVVTKNHGNTVSFAIQDVQRGTGHAIFCSKDVWHEDHILIMNGDAPLITEEIIEELFAKHVATNAAISFVTAHNADPSTRGYGRVIETDNQIRIVEEKEFAGDAHQHCCINAGIYIAKKEFLTTYIETINSDNNSKEFYITDLVKIASDEKLTVSTVSAPFDRIRGINTFQELWIAQQIKRGELIKYWMDNGVEFSVAQNVHIELNAQIGTGSRIGGGAHILGTTTIGRNCEIGEFSIVENSTMEDEAIVHSHCVVKDSHIAAHAQVGPFAHLRNQAKIGAHCIVGNFVEVKQSTLGENTKVKHLSYLGDAEIGTHVNIGAGTITCNHNGISKHKTIIQDNAYIGSNNTLVAPVIIGKKAFTGAGSVITKNVPEGALALGRSRQVNKEGYAAKLMDKTLLQDVVDSDTSSNSNSLSFIGAVKTENNPSSMFDQ